MLPAAALDRKGHTLVEMMVAILILLVGLLGLVGAINFGIKMNLSNKIRNDAISIADEHLQMQQIKNFADITTGSESRSVKLTNGFVNYSVSRIITDIPPADPTSKKVDINVGWRERGYKKRVSVSTIISKE